MSTNNNKRNKDIVATDQSHQKTLSLNLGEDFSSRLSQHEIDDIYAAEYGELTEQDRYDWILLYCGLHQDMLKIQQELRTDMLAGADLNIAAPYFFGRFRSAMEERVTALGRGEPIIVEGHPQRMPGRMMKRWAAGIAAGEPSLYHRIEAVLARRFKANIEL